MIELDNKLELKSVTQTVSSLFVTNKFTFTKVAITNGKWYSRYSDSCFAHNFVCRTHQLVHAGDETGHQGVLRDVMKRNLRMEG